MNLQFEIIPQNHPDYPAFLELRNAVLRTPLGLSLYDEDLTEEQNDWCIIAKQAGEIAGCVMLRDLQNNEKIKLRQMAVHPDFQNKGAGKKMMHYAEKTALQKGFKTITLHARQSAVPFYEKLGYECAGSMFQEVGLPHFFMQKHIA